MRLAKIKVIQRCALPQHSCKTLCPGVAEIIEAEMDVSQRSALPQHSQASLPRLR